MIARATMILDVFEAPRSRLTLEDVTHRTRLPRSTVHRILDRLVQLDLLEHGPSIGYRLGERALRIGAREYDHLAIRSSAAPLLNELHLRSGLVTHLTILDGGDSVYLDKVCGHTGKSLPTRVGGRRPAYSTASGKAMLAWLPPERIDLLYPDRLKRLTDSTIGDLAELNRELDRSRRRGGLTFERSESISGLACVGMAIRCNGRAIAGISASGDARSAPLERVAHLVMDAAQHISSAMMATQRATPVV